MKGEKKLGSNKMQGDPQDEELAKRLAKDRQLSVVLTGVNDEVWTFVEANGFHVALVRPNGLVYVRAPLDDPRNGPSQGMFFYRTREPGHMQRIRVYCGENGFVSGEIRHNTVKNYFDDWVFFGSWREK